MIQAAMYFVLGLLTAGMLALLVTPAIWRRANRLSRERVETALPMTFAEIQAEKDQLRAEFAMNTRRLEMGIARLRDETADQVIEIDSRRAEINILKVQQTEQAQTIKQLQEKAGSLEAELETANERLAKAREDIAVSEAALAERSAALTTLRAELLGSQQLADEEKVELVARDTEIGNLGDRLTSAVATAEALTSERDRLATSLREVETALGDARTELAGERQRADDLAAKLARLESEHAERLTELERHMAQMRNLETASARERVRADGLSARIRELEIERDERMAELARRTAEVEGLTTSREAPLRAVATNGQEAFADGDNVHKAIVAIEAENATLLARIASLESDIAAMSAENLELHRLLSTGQEAESENSLLRERLTSVAAEVVRLVGGTRSGDESGANGSTPSTAPDMDTNQPTDPASAQPVATTDGRTLAERLRALQHANH